MPYDRLTVLDTAFVELEAPTQPMHVGFLGVADAGPFLDRAGRFRLGEARRVIASRLHLVPRFRQRLMPVPLGQGRPVWVDHPGFDIAHHVRLAALPAPGTEHQLKELMARLQAAPLDRGQPLWELWFVEGLEGDRVAIIEKLHHALADGISGVDVANVLFDRDADGRAHDAPTWTPDPAPSRAGLLAASLAEEASRPLQTAGAVLGAVRAPGLVAGRVARVARTVRTWTSPAPATSLSVAVGAGRRFEVVRTDLDTLRTIKRAHGVTANDVVLAVVTGGLRHFLANRAETVEGGTLRAMVPVSVRAPAERGSLGNRLSALLVDLPVGEADPLARLRAVAAGMGAHKASQDWVGAELALAAADHLPALAIAPLARLLPRQRAANLLVANVPGPRTALYCLGARVHEVFPYVGPIAGMGLMISTLRYDRRLFFGLCADRDAVPDLAVLAEGIEKELAVLAGG